MRVLVTGEAGFTAHYVLPLLASAGHETVGLEVDITDRGAVEARIATLAKDKGSLAKWSEAVSLADRLGYAEPDDWFYPVRHHQGAALLAALFLWHSVSRVSRVLLAAYALAMGFTLVYTGEHYVVDVLAGWLVAVVGVGAARLVGRLTREPDALWGTR